MYKEEPNINANHDLSTNLLQNPSYFAGIQPLQELFCHARSHNSTSLVKLNQFD
jgi:hypothetical protein